MDTSLDGDDYDADNDTDELDKGEISAIAMGTLMGAGVAGTAAVLITQHGLVEYR